MIFINSAIPTVRRYPSNFRALLLDLTFYNANNTSGRGNGGRSMRYDQRRCPRRHLIAKNLFFGVPI